MATVIGMTAARGEEIAAEHIESGAVVGSDVVLTRRNAETITIPGAAGGGGPLGQSESWAFTSPLRTSGEGGLIDSGLNWSAPSNADGGDDAGVVIGGTGNEGKLILAEAGWYSVFVYLELSFDSADVITYVRMSMDCGNALPGNTEYWWVPILNGTSRWVKASANLGPIYSDGTAFLRPQVRWDSGHYGTGMHSRAVGANIVRLA